MLFLPQPINNRKQDKRNYKQDEIAERIVRGLSAVQSKASKFLQDKFETLSIGSKRLSVIAFSVACFSGSVYLSIKSFSKQANKALSITAIRMPKQAVQTERQPVQPAGVITKGEFEKIRQFRKYLDSLDNSQQGKRIHDSIIKNRPGLIDSLTVVENIYQSQSPNK